MSDEEILNARSMSLQTRRLQRKLKMKEDKDLKTTNKMDDDIITLCNCFFDSTQRRVDKLQNTANDIYNIIKNCTELFIKKHSNIIKTEFQQKHVSYNIGRLFEQILILRTDTGDLLLLDNKRGSTIKSLLDDSMQLHFYFVLQGEFATMDTAHKLSCALMRMLVEALVKIEAMKKAYHSGRG